VFVAGAVEVHDNRPGLVRLTPIADFSADSLHAFIKANVAAGATAKTGWTATPEDCRRPREHEVADRRGCAGEDSLPHRDDDPRPPTRPAPHGPGGTEHAAAPGPAAWLAAQLGRLPPKGGLAEAFRYALGNWTALTRFVGDGRIEIDNNRAENTLRGVSLGRKNWLFAGSDAGGARAAAVDT
jgi:hypothetical protein